MQTNGLGGGGVSAAAIAAGYLDAATTGLLYGGLTGEVAQSISNLGKPVTGHWVNPEAFGAHGDWQAVAGAVSITSGAAALTLAGAGFTSADVGKSITVQGAGAAGVPLTTTISAFTDSTHVTLTANAGATLSASTKTVSWGTDDTAAFLAADLALAAVGAGAGAIRCRSNKKYLVSRQAGLSFTFDSQTWTPALAPLRLFPLPCCPVFAYLPIHHI